MAVLPKGTSQWSSASYRGNWETHIYLKLEENEKQKQKSLILAYLTVSYLRKLDKAVKGIVSFPSLVTCKETLFQCFRKSTHF